MLPLLTGGYLGIIAQGALMFGANSPSGALLAGIPAGFAMDGLTGSVLVRGGPAPFSGDWNNLMHYDSPSSKLVRDNTGQYAAGTTLRCDHDADGVPLGLRHEPARTNVLLYSQDFSNAAWSKTDTTVTANATAAPDGATTADLLTEGTAGTAAIYQDGTMTSASAAVAGSIFLKPSANNSWVRVVLSSNDFVSGVNVWVNISTGALGTVAIRGTATAVHAEVEKAKNGFWRLMLGATFPAAVSGARIYFYSASADNSTTRVNNAAYYAWQAQAELGEFASSPIPTTTGAVNRAADNIYLLTSEIPYDATKGTLYARVGIYRGIGSTNQNLVALSDNTSNNYLTLRYNDASGNVASTCVNGGGSEFSGLSETVTLKNSEIKAAVSFKANDAAFICTGGTIKTDTSVNLPMLTRLQIGSRESGAQSINGWIKEIVYEPTDEPDAEITTRVAATPLGQGTSVGDLLGDAEPLGVAIDLIADQLLIRQHIGSKLQGLNGGSILYNSPSAKNIVNGWGDLESGTTMRCDHDPATLDTSTTAITDTGNGQKVMTIAGSVDYREGTLWVTATAYAVGQRVKYGIYTYRCKAAHTSGGTTEPGIGASWATNWEVVDGYRIRLTDAASLSRFMIARVVSFNTATKVLTLNVYAQSGSFACSNWKVIVALGVLFEGARTNVLFRSQEFDNASWAKADIAVTANGTTSPDGTANADLITEGTAGSAAIEQTRTMVSASAAVAGTLFVKASASITWLRILFRDATYSHGVNVWVNLSTGALGTVQAHGSATGASANIKAAANGFYRVAFAVTMPGGVSDIGMRICSASADASNTRVNNAAYYLWQAQAELGAFASSPVVTTSAAVTRAADDPTQALGALLGAEFSLLIRHRSPKISGSSFVAGGVSNTASPNFNDNVYVFNSTTLTNRGATSVISGGVSQAGLQKTSSNQDDLIRVAARIKANDFRNAVDGELLTADTSGSMPAAVMDRFVVGSAPWSSGSTSLFEHVEVAAIVPRAFTDAELPAKAA